MGKVIGIDLGTTNSVCAVIDGTEPQVVINEEGGRVTPSVVGFAKDGSRFVGDIAKRQLLINPEQTIHSIKRFMGKALSEVEEQTKMVQYTVGADESGGVTINVQDRAYSPQEISALVLQKVKKAAEDFLGESVTEAVITVPAYFTDRQRQATRDAGTIAGLDVLRIINEPTAAALAYVHDKSEQTTIAVYDWGGGTFDISILRVGEDIAEVLSTRGNNLLGGADVVGDGGAIRVDLSLGSEDTPDLEQAKLSLPNDADLLAPVECLRNQERVDPGQQPEAERNRPSNAAEATTAQRNGNQPKRRCPGPVRPWEKPPPMIIGRNES